MVWGLPFYCSIARYLVPSNPTTECSRCISTQSTLHTAIFLPGLPMSGLRWSVRSFLASVLSSVTRWFIACWMTRSRQASTPSAWTPRPPKKPTSSRNQALMVWRGRRSSCHRCVGSVLSGKPGSGQRVPCCWLSSRCLAREHMHLACSCAGLMLCL